MLTCLICILVRGFSKKSKPQKISLIRIIDILLPLTNNNPNRHRTRHAPSYLSISSLSTFSFLHLFLHSIYYLHWLDFMTQEVRFSTGDYTYSCDCQKITCILAILVSDCNRPQRLTSYNVICHFSPDCNPSLLCCVYCVIKCDWYLLSI